MSLRQQDQIDQLRSTLQDALAYIESGVEDETEIVTKIQTALRDTEDSIEEADDDEGDEDED